MRNSTKFFSFFIMVFIVACSTDPYETGPFHRGYRCDLNGLYYSDKKTYDSYCNEERAELLRKEDSILNVWLTERRIEKTCNIDNVILKSEYRVETEWCDVRVLFDSVIYHHMQEKATYSTDFLVEVYYDHGSIKYNCPDLLPPGVDSVFTDSTCSDTLGIQAIIDVFANFPDSLCEELPKD